MRDRRLVVSLSVLALLAAGCGRRDAVGNDVPSSGSAAPAAVNANSATPLAAPGELAPGESYDAVAENDFVAPRDAPLSTFSVDVDTASYANARRFVRDGALPPPAAVRVEEFVNYFSYDYPQPAGDAPFSVATEVATCPWNREHRVLRVGLKAKSPADEKLPPANLVFLIDTSGSMQDPNKLPLLVQSLGVLVDRLRPEDRVSIVTYAGSSGLALDTTPGDRKGAIRSVLSGLAAGGGTNGGEGIVQAYQQAEKGFVRGGTNRVILATDGDFNVGVTSQEELVRLIERERDTGVYLTVLRLGTGNLNDSAMEKLADKGNGNYAYIDSLDEARKVLGREAGGTLATVAKDVKIQVEFNPNVVAEYRLIGYEDRALAARDFNDDRKDAGDVGAGHTVTALYEIVPGSSPKKGEPGVDPLKYQRSAPTAAGASGELATVKLRYKEPDGADSKLVSTAVVDGGARLDDASSDFRFSAAVAQYGMLLRRSKYAGDASYDDVLALARSSTGADLDGQRAEFVDLVSKTKRLDPAR